MSETRTDREVIGAGGPGDVPDDARAALERAALLRLVAVAFARPSATWYEELTALAENAAEPGLEVLAVLAADATEGEYHALLGPGGSVPSRDVAYSGHEDPGRVLAEIAHAHEAFGFARADESEPLDHIAVETDFVAYLSIKEAYAIVNGDAEAAEVTAAAREAFVASRLAPFAGKFALRMGGGGPEYLVAATALLCRVLEIDPAAVEADLKRGGVHLPVLQDGEPMDCGPGGSDG